MSTDAANVAHLLRRTGFGPAPGEVERAGAYDDALAAVVESATDDGVEMPDPDDDDATSPITWWLGRMASTTGALDDKPSPLYEKMVLFWHSHLPSSADKANADMLVRQHNLLRRHAAGNFRDLMHAIVADAAMLVFLDAAGSEARAPNENLARELMELFTLGRGEYTEADVRGAAQALAGFTVDWDSEAVGFDEEAANRSRLTILGVTEQFDAEQLVDVICDQPACARFVAGKLYRFFVGAPASAGRLAELATGFRESGLEVRPLLENIVRGPEFVANRMTRPRFPVEWFTAAVAALQLRIDEDSMWDVETLGQLPFYPPNVSGWPVGPQWVGAGRQLLRASMALDVSWPDDGAAGTFDLGGGSPASRAQAAARHCGLYEVSSSTHAGLELAAGRIAAADDGDRLLIALALASPEAACC